MCACRSWRTRSRANSKPLPVAAPRDLNQKVNPMNKRVTDPSLYSLERLVGTMLNDRYGGHNAWRRLVTINPAYVSPFAPAGTTPKCVVQFGDVFLRHSRGPNPESSWDVYGDDFLNPELALLALCQAPVPPPALARDIWDQLERDRTVVKGL